MSENELQTLLYADNSKVLKAIQTKAKAEAKKQIDLYNKSNFSIEQLECIEDDLYHAYRLGAFEAIKDFLK